MRIFRLETETFVERPLDEVFAFFSNPANLAELTPPNVRFRIVEGPDGPLREGSVIRYRIRVRGVPIGWTSRISRWEPPHLFVDEQLRGPYRSWKHTHAFEEVDGGGTRVLDRIEYAVVGGALIHRLFVRRDLDRIFTYRAERLREIMAPAT